VTARLPSIFGKSSAVRRTWNNPHSVQIWLFAVLCFAPLLPLDCRGCCTCWCCANYSILLDGIQRTFLSIVPNAAGFLAVWFHLLGFDWFAAPLQYGVADLVFESHDEPPLHRLLTRLLVLAYAVLGLPVPFVVLGWLLLRFLTSGLYASLFLVLGCPANLPLVLGLSAYLLLVLGLSVHLLLVLGCPELVSLVLGLSAHLLLILGCPVHIRLVLGYFGYLSLVFGLPVLVLLVLGLPVLLLLVLGLSAHLTLVLGLPAHLSLVLGLPVCSAHIHHKTPRHPDTAPAWYRRPNTCQSLSFDIVPLLDPCTAQSIHPQN
jgi:hypothetical protein